MAYHFPVVLYGLLGIGVRNTTTDRALKTLVSLTDDNGFRCLGSIPNFHGPGRKEDACPIACLYAAKAISADKKNFSPTITLMALRILKRLGIAA